MLAELTKLEFDLLEFVNWHPDWSISKISLGLDYPSENVVRNALKKLKDKRYISYDKSRKRKYKVLKKGKKAFNQDCKVYGTPYTKKFKV